MTSTSPDLITRAGDQRIRRARDLITSGVTDIDPVRVAKILLWSERGVRDRPEKPLIR